MFLKKLSPNLLNILEKLGFVKATEFQRKAVSAIKSGADCVLLAPQGAGKSTAISLSVLQLLKGEEGDTPRVLLLTQMDDEIDKLNKLFHALGSETSIRVVTATERGNILEQKDKIYFGSDVVISTPKRAGELLSIEGINLISMKMLLLHNAHKILRNELLTMSYRVSESFPNAQKILSGEVYDTYEKRYVDQFMKPPKLITGAEIIKNPLVLAEEA